MPDLMELLENEVSVSAGNIMLATVVENYSDNDKQSKGLLSVKLPGLTDGTDIIRKVRVMQQYATGAEGFYFLPEVGDLVVVAFLDSGYGRGVALGSLYGSKNEGRLLDKKNQTKAISSKSGLAITFSDTEKKEKLSISTPKKQEICADDENEQIIIKPKDGIILKMDGKNGEISLEAKEKITVKCGSASIILEKDGAIKINGKDVSLEGQNITQKAKSKLDLSGQTVDISSTGEASISGSRKVEIKSSGVTEVKGATVKLNG